MNENPTVTHAIAYFSGRVQGVGFRYMTLQIAKGYEVRGYVRNLPDGRVELEAEGDEREVRAFIEALQSQLDSYIREADVRWNERIGEFKDFTIA